MKCACSKARGGKCCSNNICGCHKNNRSCGSDCGCLNLPCHNKGQQGSPEVPEMKKSHSSPHIENHPQLIPPSEEQMKIIKACQEGKNINVDAVAGSGKTTTSLHIAQSLPEKKGLLLTYNTKLKWETRQKALIYNLPNLEVHSFHAFANKYIGRCYTDPMMLRCLTKPLRGIPSYDVLIVDECQDLKDFYYKLICKIVAQLPDIQIILLGDRYQNVYRFLASDERYLTRAAEVFNLNKRPWEHLSLSTSYRLNQETADFINQCLLGEDRIKTIKRGKKPRYIIDNLYKKTPYNIVKECLKRYSVNDIMIMARSLKSDKCPARVLANLLSSKDKIPIYLKDNEDKDDDKYIQNKILFTTFCSAKGLERKVVIIIGFDRFLPCDNVPTCPNDIYVACSRNIEELILLHHNGNDYLPYLKRICLKELCHWEEREELDVHERFSSIHKKTIVELINHLPTSVILKACEYFKRTKICPAQEYINIPIDIKCGDNYEPVSHLNGIAIPAYFQQLQSGTMEIYRSLCSVENGSGRKKFTKGLSFEVSKCLLKERKLITNDFNDLSNLLRITNLYYCLFENLVHPINQISHYDWLEKDKVLQCCDRLKKYLTSQTKYEVTSQYQVPKPTMILRGSIDAIEGNTIYELKCVTELRDEHFLQLALYAWLYEKNHPGKEMIYRLFNILSGELYEIECNHEELDEMVKYLVTNKVTETIISDSNFFQNIKEMKEKFYCQKEGTTEDPDDLPSPTDDEEIISDDDEPCDMVRINLMKDVLINRGM